MWRKICLVLAVANLFALGILFYLSEPATQTGISETSPIPTNNSILTAEPQDESTDAPSVDENDEAVMTDEQSKPRKVLIGNLSGPGFDAQSFALRVANTNLSQHTRIKTLSGYNYEGKDGSLFIVGDSQLGYRKSAAINAYFQLFTNLRMSDMYQYGDRDELKRLGLTQETTGMTRSEVAQAAELLIDDLVSPSIYKAKVSRIYAYTMPQIEELRRSKTWRQDVGALKDIGVGDGFLYFIEIDMCINGIPILSDGCPVSWTEKAGWEPWTPSTYVMMTNDEVLLMDLSIKEPLGEMEEEIAVTEQSIIERYTLNAKNSCFVDPSRLGEACLQYMVARYGTGDHARYVLMPMWCFERTDGRQAYFDAVTGEHIDVLNPDYVG